MSIFQPCELLEAMSVTPMCAELYSCFLNGAHAEPVFAEAAEAEGIAESFAPYHKVLLGSAYAGCCQRLNSSSTRLWCATPTT